MSTPSTAIATNVQATQDQLWMLKYLFCANWQDGVTISTSFNTDVISNLDDTEHRYGFIDRPYRTVKASLLVYGDTDVSKFRNMIARSGQAAYLVPIYPDEMIILSVDPELTQCTVKEIARRRITIGVRCAIARFDETKRAVEIQVVTIQNISGTTLTFTGTISGTFGPGTSIYPLMEAQLQLNAEAEIITDNKLTFFLEATERTGNMTIDPSIAIGSTPSGMSTFEDLLVMDIEPDFSQKLAVGMERSGDYTKVGRGDSLQTFGSRPRWVLSLSYSQLSRETSWRLLQFFESVGGRLLSFFVPCPLTDMKIVSLTTGNITVKRMGDSIDWTYYTHITVLLKDGTRYVREIASISVVSDTDVISLESDLPSITLGEIARLSFAHRMRLASDSFEEAWITNGVLTSELKFVEVMDESDVEIEGLVDLSD